MNLTRWCHCAVTFRIVLILKNKYIFLFIFRYVRTDSWFWNFSWELCDTNLTSHLLPAHRHQRNAYTPPADAVFFFVFTIPALLHFLHPPQSSIWFRPACVHCLQLLEWKWRQEHGVVSHLIPPACVHCACVCVSQLPECIHTYHLEGRKNADDAVLNAKKGLFCSSTICCCRKFAFPHTKQLCSSHEYIKLLSTALDHHSAATKHIILF